MHGYLHFLGPQSGLWGLRRVTKIKSLDVPITDFLEGSVEVYDFSSVPRWYKNRLLRLSIVPYSSVLELGDF
jgi:hypothetical protein